MRTRHSLIFGLSAVALVGLLAGCGDLMPPEDGYEKVASRQRGPIPTPAAPNPPPVVAGIGGGAAAAVPTLPAGAPAGVTQAMVEEGQQLFGTVCSACHGAGGAGTPAGPKLDDSEWIHIAGNFEEISNVIHTGVATPREYPGGMPPLGGGNFNEEQVRAIAAYVFALSQQGS